MTELGAGNGTSYPGALDLDESVEIGNKTIARADVPNDFAAAIIKIQTELGTGTAGTNSPKGTRASVADFLQLQHNQNGTHKPFTDIQINNIVLNSDDWPTTSYYLNTDQSVGSEINVKIAFDTSLFDSAGTFDSTPYSIAWASDWWSNDKNNFHHMWTDTVTGNIYVIRYTVDADREEVLEYNSAGTLQNTFTTTLVNLESRVWSWNGVSESGTIAHSCTETHIKCTDTRPTTGANYTDVWGGGTASPGTSWTTSGPRFTKTAVANPNKVSRGAFTSDSNCRLWYTDRNFIGAWDKSTFSTQDTDKAFGVGKADVCTPAVTGDDSAYEIGDEAGGGLGGMIGDSSGVIISTNDVAGAVHIYEFDVNGDLSIDIDSGGGDISTTVSEGLAVDSNYIYYLDRGDSGTLKLFDRTDGSLFDSHLDSSKWGATARGLAVDNNYIYIADQTQRTLTVLGKSDYRFLLSTTASDATLSFLTPQQTILANGKIYVSDTNLSRKRIYEFYPVVTEVLEYAPNKAGTYLFVVQAKVEALNAGKYVELRLYKNDVLWDVARKYNDSAGTRDTYVRLETIDPAIADDYYSFQIYHNHGTGPANPINIAGNKEDTFFMVSRIG